MLGGVAVVLARSGTAGLASLPGQLAGKIASLPEQLHGWQRATHWDVQPLAGAGAGAGAGAAQVRRVQGVICCASGARSVLCMRRGQCAWSCPGPYFQRA